MLFPDRDDSETADPTAADRVVSAALPIGVQQQRPATAPDSDFARRIEDEISFLRRAARRWYRDGFDAEDLIQDTIVQALAGAHLWQPGSDLRAWLFTIMRNRFLAISARSNLLSCMIETIAWAGEAPAQAAHEPRLILRDLARALARLPYKQREAVRLVGVEGKSYSEVAAIMGISVHAIRCHLARGRNRLRAALHGDQTRHSFASRPTTRESSATAPRPVSRNIRAALARAAAD